MFLVSAGHCATTQILNRCERRNHAREDVITIRRSEDAFARPVWMGHHAQDITTFIEDAGTVGKGTVRVGLGGDLSRWSGVTEGYAIFCFKSAQRGLIAEIVAFHMAYRDLKYLVFFQVLRERAIGCLCSQMDLAANVLESSIAHQGSGQETGLTEDLESIADAQDQSPLGSKLLHRLHDGREACDGAGAQIVSVGKASRHENRVAVFQTWRVMPEAGNRLPGYLSQDMVGIVIAV